MLGGEGKCWNKNELLLERMFLDKKDMVSILCSLGNSEVCGPTKVVVFESSFNKSSVSRKRWGRTFQKYSRIA